jgi:hypothetical protein
MPILRPVVASALLALASVSCTRASLPASSPASAAGAVSSAIPAAARGFALVRPRFSGDRALEIVAFMDHYWRIAGNTGFDRSIDSVASVLRAAGYVEESRATPRDRLTYRIESRPMDRPTWEPESASVTIVGASAPLLRSATNRNMVAINSQATPAQGIEADVVALASLDTAAIARADVRGKVVYADAPVSKLFAEAVQKRGAIGVLAYNMPSYTRPEVNRRSIQFSSIALDTTRRAWGILLSYEAREALRAALARGPVRVRVAVAARSYPSPERTLVADVRGSAAPEERWVFSAHVQEPGANDDASGVGTQAEMARVLASLVRSGEADPKRTITFLWGDEIRAIGRYLTEDSTRLRGVRWGMSLDMVGENTARTGGTFLIEKMPDPSAVWTRGDDHHTEWGGEAIPLTAVVPHYFNDFVLARCMDVARTNGWVVRTNPFEGGSDHVPFLTAHKPGVLMWHFTDQFYHTDGDRLEMVSSSEMANVGTAALVSAMTMASADGETARAVVAETERAADARLDAELALSRQAIAAGGDRAHEQTIVRAWGDYYVGAIRAATDIELGGTSDTTRRAIDEAAARVAERARRDVAALGA